MKIHYLEIVTTDIDSICATFEATHSVRFSDPVESLGGARTCELPDDSFVGVRAPLSETEQPIVRPYWLVADIHGALKQAEDAGAQIAHPALEIPGRGTFAIFIQGGNNHGLWQI